MNEPDYDETKQMWNYTELGYPSAVWPIFVMLVPSKKGDSEAPASNFEIK